MGKDLKGKELGKGVRQKSDGKYYARFVSATGKRPEKSFVKLQEAKLWLEEQRYLDKHSQLSTTNNVTLNAWYDYWEQKIIAKSVRNTTVIVYRNRYNQLIKPVIGHMQLSNIKPIHCQEVINKGREQYSFSSISQAIIIMKQLFDSAVDNKLISITPLTKTIKYPQKEVRERRVFSAAEQKMFVDYLTPSKLPYKEQMLFVLETGLRCGELMGLKWNDVDFKKRCIHVQRTLIWIHTTKQFEEHPPKTASGNRIIPLTDTAFQILWHRRQQKTIYQYVFQSTDRIVRTGNYDDSLRSICKIIGLESISMHGLRHSFATRCIENGMNPKTLQKIMGHSTLAITMDLYVHVTEETLFNEVTNMGMKYKMG